MRGRVGADSKQNERSGRNGGGHLQAQGKAKPYNDIDPMQIECTNRTSKARATPERTLECRQHEGRWGRRGLTSGLHTAEVAQLSIDIGGEGQATSSSHSEERLAHETWDRDWSTWRQMAIAPSKIFGIEYQTADWWGCRCKSTCVHTTGRTRSSGGIRIGMGLAPSGGQQ